MNPHLMLLAFLIGLTKLTFQLALMTVVPAALLAGFTWLFEPGAAMYVFWCVWVLEFFQAVQRVRFVPVDGDDGPDDKLGHVG